MRVDGGPKTRRDRQRVRIRELSDRLIFSLKIETQEALRAELQTAIRDARRELADGRHDERRDIKPTATRRAKAV